MSLVGEVNVETGVAGFALGAMSDAIQLLYKVSGSLNDFRAVSASRLPGVLGP